MSLLLLAALQTGATLAADPIAEAVERRFRAALAAVEQGAEGLAEDALVAIAYDYPAFAPAWIELAALHLRLDWPAQALAAAHRAVWAAPEHPLPLLEEARALVRLQRTAEAVARYQDAIACGDSVEARLELGSLLARLRRAGEAEAQVRAANLLAPRSPRLLGALGRVLYHSKRYHDAIAAFTLAEELGLRDPALLLEHGRAREALADLTQAVAVYRRGSQWFPYDARPSRRLGAILLELGQPEAALAPLERARSLDPTEPETHERLGLALGRTGRLEEAAKALSEAVHLDPDLARAHYELGTVLADLGRNDEAEVALLRFHELQQARDRADHAQGKIGTLNRQGLKLYREGRHLEAIEVFEAALALAPGSGAIHANLGLALLAAGNPAGAVEAVTRAIALDGESLEVARILAEARAELPGETP